MKDEIELYPHKYEVKNEMSEILSLASKEDVQCFSEVLVQSAARVISTRVHAKFIFYTVRSLNKSIQLLYQRKESDKIELLIHRGDSIGFNGYPGKSKTGELTVKVKELKMLSPSLRDIPSVKNLDFSTEIVYRKRYLDLFTNETSAKRFIDRSRIIRFIREYFEKREFIEVETPMLNLNAGGASAKPFKTHLNEMDLNFELRIATELYLKQLVIGGFDRVFEIGKNFRNEGIDATHNPEFTSLEFYQAYADVYDLMDTTEELLHDLVVKIKGKNEFDYSIIKNNGEEIEKHVDFKRPFRRIDILTEIGNKLQLELDGENIELPETLEILIKKSKEMNIVLKEPMTLNKVLDCLISELIEPQCINPTFITGHPLAMSPLAKNDRKRKGITERFELFVLGKEICNAYTELNMPEEQRKRFIEQAKDKKAGDDEAMPADEEFCVALEHGLPPTGGCGIGIDRLVMFLTNVAQIRDVILFPTLKPVDKNEKK